MLHRNKGILPVVFYPTITFIIIISGIGGLFPDEAQKYLSNAQHWVTTTFGWLYVLAMAVYLCVCLFLMLSRYGNIKLGDDHEQPEYKRTSWFAMLFSAGMGIGLMFFSIAEPIQHFISPPYIKGKTLAAAKDAMNITFFHWGLQAWSLYAIVGLCFAYFSYRHKLPLLPRSALYPLIGQRIYGRIGHSVDIFAILGTIFGIATSLGLGAIQINAGVHYLFNVPVDISVQIVLIVIIIIIATFSVTLGLDRGIKVLSNINLLLALGLLLFILICGNTIFLIETYLQNVGDYFGSIVNQTFNLYAYQNNTSWLGDWTLFYWGWWIAWSPFVGLFIAKISRGRTVREFLIGVLFIPTGFTFMWLTIFGNSAINLIQQGNQQLSQAAVHNVPSSLFVFLQSFPYTSVISVIALIVITIFFVTSSDSGSLVMDMLATGGAKHSSAWHRIFWSMTQGVLAITLLYAGGLQALQIASIISALPLIFIISLMVISIVMALRKDSLKSITIEQYQSGISISNTDVSWQKRIDYLLSSPQECDGASFLKNIVEPAMINIQSYLKQKSIESSLDYNKNSIQLKIIENLDDSFIYLVNLKVYDIQPCPPSKKINREQQYRPEVFLNHGNQYYSIYKYSESQVIADIITQYEKHLHFIHISQATRNDNI